MVADFSITKSDSSKIVSFLGSREVTLLRRAHRANPSRAKCSRWTTTWSSTKPSASPTNGFGTPCVPIPKERAVYSMVDSVKRVPLYRNIYTIINTVVGGYYNTRYVGVALFQAAQLQSAGGRAAPVGGLRPRNSAAACGFGLCGLRHRDERFKGGGTLELMLRRQLTRKLTLGYKRVVQLGAGHNALAENNILSSILSRGNTQKLSMIDEAGPCTNTSGGTAGAATSARVQHMLPNRYVPMFRPDGQAVRAVDNFALGVGLRLSWDETVLRTVRQGLPEHQIPRADRRFHGRTERNHPQQLRIRTAGRPPELPARTPADRLFPHHRGGRTSWARCLPAAEAPRRQRHLFLRPIRLFVREFHEFASDTAGGALLRTPFNGFLLGKIPLIRKLNWREVLVFKGVYGTLSDRNNGSLPDSRAFCSFR